MIIVASSGAQCGRCRLVAALGLAGLLMTLAGCAAGDMAGSVATPTSANAVAAAPVAGPAAAIVAPQSEPRVLSATEINEQCWMSSEVNKLKDLDAKAKLVNKCVAEKMKGQGM